MPCSRLHKNYHFYVTNLISSTFPQIYITIILSIVCFIETNTYKVIPPINSTQLTPHKITDYIVCAARYIPIIIL